MSVSSEITQEVKDFVRKTPFYQHLPYLYLEAKKARTILELGLREGYSTRTVLYGLRDGKQGHLWSVDWGVDPSTAETVRSIQNSELGEYFTWVNRDITSLSDSWFKKREMDLVFPDAGLIEPGKKLLNRYLSSLSKGGRLFLFGVERASFRKAFLKELDRSKYRIEAVPSRAGVLHLGAVIITKEVDD